MTHNLTRRLGKIEKKVGSDTSVIRGFADVVRINDKISRGIKVGPITCEPKLAEIIRQAARAQRESEDNGQEH